MRPICAGVAQADVLPRLAGVGGLVHADAGRDVAARARRPGADVDHVRDRIGATAIAPIEPASKKPSEMFVQVVPASVGPPHAAAGAAHVVELLVAGTPATAVDAAAAAEDAQVAERDPAEQRRVEGGRLARRRRGGLRSHRDRSGPGRERGRGNESDERDRAGQPGTVRLESRGHVISSRPARSPRRGRAETVPDGGDAIN